MLAIDAEAEIDHNLEVSEDGELLIIKWDAIWRIGADGRIHRVAGRARQPGYSGDGGPALAARMRPVAMTRWEGLGLLISDASNRIRLLDRHGRIWTVAGDGWPGFRGDGGAALHARMRTPFGATPLPSGGFAFADSDNGRIRVVDSVTIPPPDPAPTPTGTPAPTSTPGAPPADSPTPQPTPIETTTATPTPTVAPIATAPFQPRPEPAPTTDTRNRSHTPARVRLTHSRLLIELPARASADLRCLHRGCRTTRRHLSAGRARRIDLPRPRGTRYVLTITLSYADGSREQITLRARKTLRRCRPTPTAAWQTCPNHVIATMSTLQRPAQACAKPRPHSSP
jgi:hypothetical protein